MSNAGQTIVGSGDHTYVWESDFLKLPEGVSMEADAHAVVQDSQGRIYVHSQSEHAVLVLEPDGTYISSWGSWLKKGAHGFNIRSEDGVEYAYLAATGLNIVVKTTLDGEVVWQMGAPQESGVYSSEKEFVPTNVALAPNGDIYVADGYGKSYVHQYNIKDEYIRSWGGKGSEAGQLDGPHGIWIDTRGAEPIVVVADRTNNRLQNFTLDGQHISFVTDELRLPCHFDQRGTELLIPDLAGRVTIFDADNKLIVHLGDNPDPAKRGKNNIPSSEWVDGEFISPHGACFDSEGNILVAEWLKDGGRVTRLRRIDG